MLVLPAISKGTVVGLFCCFRELGTRRFDRYDMEMAMDFAARQAVFFDHATRYNREHATALTLQRAMLPTGLSYPSSIDVRHRYLPGSELVEVGGDWYESIRLPGARVALVVGDVAGHGVRAAVTMGRLRTAIQTLAMLELPPAATLQQLDELMQNIGEREPHFATCAYGVYDAVTGEIELAVAGHLPPLLVNPDGTNEYLEVAAVPAARHHRRRRRRDHPAPGRGRIAVRPLHRRPGRVPRPGHQRGPGPAAGRVRRGRAGEGPRGPVQDRPRRRLLRRQARRHRGAHRQAAADS